MDALTKELLNSLKLCFSPPLTNKYKKNIKIKYLVMEESNYLKQTLVSQEPSNLFKTIFTSL